MPQQKQAENHKDGDSRHRGLELRTDRGAAVAAAAAAATAAAAAAIG